MSIRLRLTLLYSLILALTLVVFGTILYVTQVQVTYADLKANLTRQAEGSANGIRRFPSFASDSSVMTIPGRWTQVLKSDGSLIARTMDLSDSPLPLSERGLGAAQNGAPWFETANVDGDPLLIYSLPVLSPDRSLHIVQVAAPIAEREQSLNTLRWILVIGSILVLLAAFAIGWVLAGTALDPIHRITATAQAIGMERDFSRRVEHTGPHDEIGQLATTFNGMVSELETSYRQVEGALQTQRRFVADASHELRTPLTTVRGNIELLLREPPLGAQERADVLSDARDEVDRLIRLVNQLLVLARADAGRALRAEPVEVCSLINDIYRQAKLLAPERNVRCETTGEDLVLGDRDAIKQVLLILLDNALVHTQPKAHVSITALPVDGHVAIQVSDTGDGISADLLPHIFERFFRGQVSRSSGGTGLGLSIAKELVEAQHGSITVVSKPGHGSEFTVSLPRVEA